VLGTIQRLLVHERIKFNFVTVCMIIIAPDRRSLRMCLAGHPPPLLITGNAARVLPDRNLGLPLGVLPDASWEPIDVELDPGWSLLLTTDGVFEGRVPGRQERLGLDNLAGLLMRILDEIPDWRQCQGAVLDRLIAEVEGLNQGPLDDDVAMAMLTHAAAEGR
jgi:serine phosphatase RsbU (regulator of sigma subunit)